MAKSSRVLYDPADFTSVEEIALSFPGAERSVSHEGTPSVKVRGKLMCRLHESGKFISIHLNFAIRDQLLDEYPDTFHLPEHFKKYPYICLWVGNHPKQLLLDVLEYSWRGLASKKQIAEFEQAS